MKTNEYIIVMNQFLNGGVENLFLSIAEKRKQDIFYLIVLNKIIEESKINSLPKNVNFIDFKEQNKFKRFLYFSRFINTKLKHIKIMIDFHEILFCEFFMKFNSKKKYCVHWFNSNPYMRLNKNKNDKYLKFYSFYKKTICICESQKELLLKLFPKKKESDFYVSNNFVDVEKIIKSSLEKINLDFKYILMVSRVDFGAKDFFTVIKAYEKLNSALQKEYKLVFVGDGPNFEDLKKIVSNSSVQKNIFLLGNQKNPYSFIKNATLLIQSSFSEGFSLITLESWALETPVILSNFLCSSKELSNNENSTLLFEIGNSIQLKEKIEIVLKNNTIKEQLILNGKKQLEHYCSTSFNSLNNIFEKGFYL